MVLPTAKTDVGSRIAGLRPGADAYLAYLRTLRTLPLHKAKLLPKMTDMNMSEAACEGGGNDPKYFSRVFSEQF